jgi:hypothetical protein
MEKVIKKRLDILNILVKRLGKDVGQKAHDQILYGKGKRKVLPTDGAADGKDQVIFK